MTKRQHLTELEQIVLLALVRLREYAYGMSVWVEIEKRIGRRCLIGTVYSTLDRLEQKGYVSSLLGDPVPERGGRAKRYYRIEAPGETALQNSRQALESMWSGLDPVLGRP